MLRRDLALDALEQTVYDRGVGGRPLFDQGDWGVQYISVRYTSDWPRPGIEPSVGSVGESYDNALAETIIELYKTEVIRPHGLWRTLESVVFATLEWVHWFKHLRLLKPIGHVPPTEVETAYHRRQAESAMAARLKRNGLREIWGGFA